MLQPSLYAKNFDFSPFDKIPKAIICLLFTPRSGSTLLACLMQQTMALGFPLEYFDPVNIAILNGRLSEYSIHHLEPIIRIRTSPNGVFSFKWNNAMDSLDSKILFDQLNPNYFLMIDREDNDAQAVSLATARFTREWVRYKGQRGVGRPSLSEKQILEAKSIIKNKRISIENFLSSKAVSALCITYEKLLTDPTGTINEILEFVNIESNIEIDINKVPILKQS